MEKHCCNINNGSIPLSVHQKASINSTRVPMWLHGMQTLLLFIVTSVLFMFWTVILVDWSLHLVSYNIFTIQHCDWHCSLKGMR